MLSIYNARVKQRSIRSHREGGVYEGIVEKMKKEINLRNKNWKKKATHEREMWNYYYYYYYYYCCCCCCCCC